MKSSRCKKGPSGALYFLTGLTISTAIKMKAISVVLIKAAVLGPDFIG